MDLNRKSEWKAMTIYISRELPLFNFERLDILCTWIEHPSEKLWPFQFLESFFFQFRACRYVMFRNRTSVWKVMSIWISRELTLFNFECLDILQDSIGHSSKKLLLFEFSHSFYIQFRASQYITGLTRTSELKVIVVCICDELQFSIMSVSISDVPESDIWVKSNDNFNFSGASIFQ